MPQIRFLSRQNLIEALPIHAAVEGMKVAYAELSRKQAAMPLRGRTSVSDQGVVLTMPAFVPSSESLGVKIVSVFPNNVSRDLPMIHALVMVFDATTGEPRAIIEGGSLTAIRTGAGSGAATDLLARQEANTVAIIGSGVQARTQLEAVCAVRPIESVTVFSLNASNAQRFVEEMQGIGAIPAQIKVASTPEDAIQAADIICTATTSLHPVFDGRFVKSGAHINAVGSYTPQMQEVDPFTLQRSLIVVDSREAALAEAGEIIIAMQQGQLSTEAIHAEIGEIITGAKAGRTSDEQITYFKSVGVAVQDAVAAKIALDYAEAHNIGTLINL